MPDMMPEKEAYDEARRRGVRVDLGIKGIFPDRRELPEIVLDGEGDLEREWECGLRSRRGVRSLCSMA